MHYLRSPPILLSSSLFDKVSLRQAWIWRSFAELQQLLSFEWKYFEKSKTFLRALFRPHVDSNVHLKSFVCHSFSWSRYHHQLSLINLLHPHELGLYYQTIWRNLVSLTATTISLYIGFFCSKIFRVLNWPIKQDILGNDNMRFHLKIVSSIWKCTWGCDYIKQIEQ